MAFINHSTYILTNYVNVLDVSYLTMVSYDVAIRFVIIAFINQQILTAISIHYSLIDYPSCNIETSALRKHMA